MKNMVFVRNLKRLLALMCVLAIVPITYVTAAGSMTVTATDGTNIFADTPAAVSGNTDRDALITVSGTTSTPNKWVSLMVPDSSAAGSVSYIDQTVSDSNGAFSFQLYMPSSAKSGVYEIRAAEEGGQIQKKYFVIGQMSDITIDAPINDVAIGAEINFTGVTTHTALTVELLESASSSVVLATGTATVNTQSQTYSASVPTTGLSAAGTYIVKVSAGETSSVTAEAVVTSLESGDILSENFNNYATLADLNSNPALGVGRLTQTSGNGTITPQGNGKWDDAWAAARFDILTRSGSDKSFVIKANTPETGPAIAFKLPEASGYKGDYVVSFDAKMNNLSSGQVAFKTVSNTGMQIDLVRFNHKYGSNPHSQEIIYYVDDGPTQSFVKVKAGTWMKIQIACRVVDTDQTARYFIYIDGKKINATSVARGLGTQKVTKAFKGFSLSADEPSAGSFEFDNFRFYQIDDFNNPDFTDPTAPPATTPPATTPPSASNNAKLASLTYQPNGESVTQVPGFSTTNDGGTYEVSLAAGTTSVTVGATKSDANASMTVSPVGGIVDVTSGSGTAAVNVTAQDGVTTRTFTVNFTVTTTPPATTPPSASNNAKLASLTYQPNGGSVTQVPGFSTTNDGGTYEVSLAAGTTSVTMGATKSDANASVTVLPVGGIVDVTSGSGTATVSVTAQDGVTTRMFTVNFMVTTTEQPATTPPATTPPATTPPTTSNNARLASLTYQPNGRDVTTVPGFLATDDGKTYHIDLPSGVTSVTVGATTADTGASLTVSPVGGIVDVTSGVGSATVTVTAPNGITANIYAISFSAEGPTSTPVVTPTPTPTPAPTSSNNNNNSGGGPSIKKTPTPAPSATPGPDETPASTEEPVGTDQPTAAPDSGELPSDISGSWSEEYVKDVIEKGIMTGYGDNTFRPDGELTRAEFATAVARYLKLDVSAGGKAFSDTKGHWSEDYVGALADKGIITGNDADSFGPDEAITREQIAVILVRAFAPDVVVDDFVFADDSSISDWAKEAVYIARAMGWMTGDEAGFRPGDTATRGEIAAVLSRLSSAGV